MSAAPTEVDVAVVGGGIAGVSVAAAIGRRRHVVLLEQEARLAQHSTGRSAASYVASYGPAPVRALTRASRAALLATAPDGAPVLRPRPFLWAAFDDDAIAELDQLCADVAELERLDSAEVRRRHDALRGEPLQGAFERDAYDIDVLGLHQHLVREARAAGVDVRTGATVRGVDVRADGRAVLDTTAGSVVADVVVDAAGAWADEVGAMLGAAPVGFRPLRRTIAISRPSRAVDPDWPFVVDLGGGCYFKPEGPNVLVSPADETPDAPGEPRVDEVDVALALDRANEVSDLGLRSVQTSWAGLRTFAPDGNPVVGFDPDAPALFWCAGQGGYGIQLAPALAEVAAALLLDEPLPDHVVAEGLDVGDLRPGRHAGPGAGATADPATA